MAISTVKPFINVVEGDIAEDYNGNKYVVLSKLSTLFHYMYTPFVKVWLQEWDCTGACAPSELELLQFDDDEIIEMIALHDPNLGGKSVTRLYGPDGACVYENKNP
jgi:hypothetical protein